MIKKCAVKSVENKNQMGILLRKLAELVEKSSETEIGDLLSGSRSLQIKQTKSGKRMSPLKDQKPDVSFPDIAQKLKTCKTRDAGKELLQQEVYTKAQAEKLVRFLDLPVHRTDKIETLLERIVESEIGSRLRSEAVQGISVSM